MSGLLPLGQSWHGRSRLGRVCCCGSTMSLEHIWSSCPSYDLEPLFSTLYRFLGSLEVARVYAHSPAPGLSPLFTLQPTLWHGEMWFPLLAFRSLETGPHIPCFLHHPLSASCRAWESALGHLLWFIWKSQMREIFAEPPFRFFPHPHPNTLHILLFAPPPPPLPPPPPPP